MKYVNIAFCDEIIFSDTFWTDRQTDRPTDRPTDRQTDRQTLWFIGKLHFQKKKLQEIFTSMDTDGSGTISQKELADFLRKKINKDIKWFFPSTSNSFY